MAHDNKIQEVRAIENGTVIDHIPSDQLFKIIRIMQLDRAPQRITFGMNLESKRMGSKAIIKIADRYCLDKEINRWVFGGNRSGKTECGAAECVYLARGIHPYRENRKDTCGWVVSLSTQVQRDVAQKKILHYLRRDWICRNRA